MRLDRDGRPQRVTSWYNEIDPYCADWLRSLIHAQLIPPGDVDERPIQDVVPADLSKYAQCHFFAGIAGWPRALSLASVSPDRPLWTGSCPCQPFSQAGQARGFADERHLWPYWFHLINIARPGLVLGEQVASRPGLEWLDLVHADLEGAGYAVGCADLGAAGVGAPHIRQRLFFVGVADSKGRESRELTASAAGYGGAVESAGGVCVVAHAGQPRAGRHAGAIACAQGGGEGERIDDRVDACDSPLTCGAAGELGDSERERETASRRFSGRPGVESRRSFWSEAEWLECRDGKLRPTRSGLFPLSHGVPTRVAKLRALGNAIVPQAAAAFIQALNL